MCLFSFLFYFCGVVTHPVLRQWLICQAKLNADWRKRGDVSRWDESMPEKRLVPAWTNCRVFHIKLSRFTAQQGTPPPTYITPLGTCFSRILTPPPPLRDRCSLWFGLRCYCTTYLCIAFLVLELSTIPGQRWVQGCYAPPFSAPAP